MNAIFNRRSIRRYLSRPVPAEMITAILQAGMAAPSAGNQRPWQFVIVQSETTRIQLSTASPYAGMVKDAPCALLVCGDMDMEQNKGFWVQDCSAATQNILIRIADLGLGGVWLGVYPLEERIAVVRRILSLPEVIIPFALIALGFPDEHKPPNDRYETEKVHYEAW